MEDDEVYDLFMRKSPPFQPSKIRLQPSPSPPPNVPDPSESDSSPDSPSRKAHQSRKHHHSQGDAVLVALMGSGKHEDVARNAGQTPLASYHEADEPLKGSVVKVEEKEKDPEDDECMGEGDEEEFAHGEEEEATMEIETISTTAKRAPSPPPEISAGTDSEAGKEAHAVRINDAPVEMDLKALALGALAAQTENTSQPKEPSNGASEAVSSSKAPTGVDAMEGVKPTIPSLTTLYIEGSSMRSPDLGIKRDLPSAPSSAGELPPILQSSGQIHLTNGNGSGQITLPSISDQLGDLKNLHEPPSATNSTFSQSPPGRPPPQFASVPPGHGSPKSPNDTFRRELPSPGRSHFYSFAKNHRRPSQTEGHPYTSPGDYSSSNTETPSTDQSGSTPATMGIDRMSIDGITNPQIGGFQCTYPGCSAQPFQTQYLLNSHANVHSSNRPHYCSVKGCPRSEGGKGFKRKNEMIRHGLVHDSPGYVCPFCPDREHKYPRPDNLQRHVRVHHVDRDKDDPQLREVLSQRPEGPSRGRRRRGGTS